MHRIRTQTINKQIIPNFILGINFNKLNNPNNLQARNKVSLISTSNICKYNYIKITFKVNVNYGINTENRIFVND